MEVTNLFPHLMYSVEVTNLFPHLMYSVEFTNLFPHLLIYSDPNWTASGESEKSIRKFQSVIVPAVISLYIYTYLIYECFIAD